MRTASDAEILAAARADARVIVSADTDFGELLARTNADGPSVLLIRRQGQRRARQLAALILANLDEVAEDLNAGAVVVLDADRIRVRRLPIRPH
jgi:predicted nuclease of predicted toxin-antitoxin system